MIFQVQKDPQVLAGPVNKIYHSLRHLHGNTKMIVTKSGLMLKSVQFIRNNPFGIRDPWSSDKCEISGGQDSYSHRKLCEPKYFQLRDFFFRFLESRKIHTQMESYVNRTTSHYVNLLRFLESRKIRKRMEKLLNQTTSHFVRFLKFLESRKIYIE